MASRKKSPTAVVAASRQLATTGQVDSRASSAAFPSDQVSIPVSIIMSRAAASRLQAFMAHGQNRFVVSSSDGALSVRIAMVVARSSATEEIVPHLGNAAIDWDRGIIAKDGRATPISRTELRLLACLVEHAGATVPHDVLISSAWCASTPDDAAYNALAVYVCYLRRSLKSIGLGQALRTVRGVGYALGEPSDDATDANSGTRNRRQGSASIR
jgi:DNA-binding response OmpR family regulator